MIYLENSMITVHHLNNSRSQRVLWMLEELAQPYEIKRYQRDPKTMLAPDTLRNVHPLGKSPVITDGALTVAEVLDQHTVDGQAFATSGESNLDRRCSYHSIFSIFSSCGGIG